MCSPQVSIHHVNPPFVGLEPLKRQKVNIENACKPPVCLLADSKAGMINGDVTTTCIRQLFRGPHFIISTMQAETTPIFKVFGMTGPSTNRELNP